MTPDQSPNAETFILITVLMMITAIIIVVIRAYAGMRGAYSSPKDTSTSAALIRIEQELVAIRTKIDALDAKLHRE